VTILVTGATGFIGRRLLALLAPDHDLVALARGAPPEAVAAHATWVRADLARPLDPATLPARVDTIVHLAQSYRFREFPAGARDVVAINVDAVAALADYAVGAGARRFVLASTGGVYAFRDEPLREDAQVAPAGFYAASKLAAEVLLAPYAALFETTVLRPFFVYGAGQRGMLVATLAERVLRGEQVTIDGDPGLRINPVHVRDAARAVAAAVAAGAAPGVVNIAGGEIVTLTQVVEGLAAAAGVEPRIEYDGRGPAGHLVADTTRMRDVLGITPEVGVDEGLRDVVADLRA
jgi:nucleoside-diphosphate-sugar epimerase